MIDEIIFMQVRLFRMFREHTGLSSFEANKIFNEQGIWTFIEECYDYLHLQGDEANLADIFAKIKAQGVAV